MESERAPRPLSEEPYVLSLVTAELAAAGLAGEQRAAQLLYLAVTSRILARPVSAALKGPSSAGKSYTVEQVLALFPPSAFYKLSAMSEHALVYDTEPLVHRMLVVLEAAGMATSENLAYFVRTLLSEGEIDYVTVEKTGHGIVPRRIHRPGPTGLITTTTAVHLHPENETRMLTLPVTDDPEQTRAVFRAQAAVQEDPRPRDLTRWHELQAWLAEQPAKVSIPYVYALAEAVPAAAIRLRRDFGVVVTLIATHALLHQRNRERDGQGRIVATLHDYRVVRDLVGDLMAEQAERATARNTRATVQTVAELTQGGGETTVRQVAVAMDVDQSTAWRRVRVAIAAGHVRNLEERRRQPARLVLGDPLPTDQGLLPDPDRLQMALPETQTQIEADYPRSAWDASV